MQSSEVPVLLMSLLKKLMKKQNKFQKIVRFSRGQISVYCCIKWQLSWDASDTGRTLYDYTPAVSLKTPRYVLVPFKEKKVISQLRLGYTLNEYRHKTGLKESPLCSCGAIKTVEHYICDCENRVML